MPASSPSTGPSTTAAQLAGRRVLVTGATGFVGTALIDRLVAAGARVRGLVRSTSADTACAWLRRRGVELRVGDVAAEDHSPLRAAADGCDLVVHCAAVIGYRRRLYGAMTQTNVMGTRAVVRACREASAGRLVHVSSIAAVGVTDDPRLLDESVPYDAWRLRSPYFDTKHQAELEVLRGVSEGLDATIVNPAAIYGPSLAPSNSSQVIATIVRRRPARVPTGGINVVPLDTVVDGIIAAALIGRTGRRTILGGENLAIAQLVERVARIAGRPVTPRTFGGMWGPPLRAAMELVEPWVPDRVWFTPDMCACFARWMWFDTGRAREELGVVASPLDDCLAATIDQLRRDGRV